MSKYIKRAQVLLTLQQYKAVISRANDQHQSVGEFLREVIQREIISKEDRKKRKTAVRELLSGKFAAPEPFNHVRWKQEYGEMKSHGGFK